LRSAYEDKGVEFGDGTVQSQLRKLLESREE